MVSTVYAQRVKEWGAMPTDIFDPTDSIIHHLPGGTEKNHEKLPVQ
jgi:hypothetical protein